MSKLNRIDNVLVLYHKLKSSNRAKSSSSF